MCFTARSDLTSQTIDWPFAMSQRSPGPYPDATRSRLLAFRAQGAGRWALGAGRQLSWEMNGMKTLAAWFAGLTALLVVGCSGPAEDAAHRRADAVDEAGERQADALERQAAATSNEAEETALNRQADAVENAADRKSDEMHRQVDKDF